MPYMNMNYPLMNMNQAYMINPNYSQKMNYHQMSGMRPNMQMMMQHGVHPSHVAHGSHGANYNQMMMPNMNNIPPQGTYNMNLYNQRNMNPNIQNNKKNLNK
jgi:hypothetical protein